MLFSFSVVSAQGVFRPCADQIMDCVLDSVPSHAVRIGEYNADLYVKGKVKIRKRNLLFRYLPTPYSFDRRVNDYMTESYSELHYTAPDIYDQKVRQVTSTFRRNDSDLGNAQHFFKMNIYSSTFLTDRVLSPLTHAGRKYYRYEMDSIWIEKGDTLYRIGVKAKYQSDKLVDGYIVARNGNWSLSEVCFMGHTEFLKYQVSVVMGSYPGGTAYLPKRTRVNLVFSLLGNRVESNYLADFSYKYISLSGENRQSLRKKHMHDLSESYRLTNDSSRFVSQNLYMNFRRPFPLTDEENIIYTKSLLSKNYSQEWITQSSDSPSKLFWEHMENIFLSSHTLNMSEGERFKIAPIFNPAQFSYSHSSGLTYKQKFVYSHRMSGERSLAIVPWGRYCFGRKELYWGVDSRWVYYPSLNASVNVELGGGNRIYSSRMQDEMKAIPDSVFDFEKLNLDYYRDNYFRLMHEIEPVNGLRLAVGFSVHHRVPQNVNKISSSINLNEVEDVMARIKVYNSFAPRIRIDWTPGQYYYMKGKSKVNLRSPYPSFSIDWERGIKSFLGSNGRYERWELDMQHHICYPAMRSLYYRVGGGLFTEQKDIYFADFSNFYRNDLVGELSDDAAGSFQLLDRRWFNSSSKYFRGHVTYEMPFFIFAHWGKFTRVVRHERLYLSLLCIPRLTPYIECGYGFETHLFDLGLFASYAKNKYNGVGISFSFGLFK